MYIPCNLVVLLSLWNFLSFVQSKQKKVNVVGYVKCKHELLQSMALIKYYGFRLYMSTIWHRNSGSILSSVRARAKVWKCITNGMEILTRSAINNAISPCGLVSFVVVVRKFFTFTVNTTRYTSTDSFPCLLFAPYCCQRSWVCTRMLN